MHYHDDALSVFSENLFFSSLDLYSGYWQIPMKGADKSKTAFVTEDGLFEINVMPFGLTNAPATFQRLMDAVLAGLKWNTLLVYLYDIIIFSKSFDDHIRDVSLVLDRLSETNLQLKPSKCHFFQRELSYLGHVISAEEISADPKKTQAIVQMKTPSNVTEVCAFIGMCSYYRIFVENFAEKCAPLYNLTHKGVVFDWTKAEEKCFQLLKSEFTKDTILSHPNFEQEFIKETDACDNGLGAVLFQRYEGRVHVVQFISRTLQPAERKWCVREKEALAILRAIEMFRVYVAGVTFTVETDHKSLEWLMKTQEPPRLVRWALRLQEYRFRICINPED
jgi:hypothetical protein